MNSESPLQWIATASRDDIHRAIVELGMECFPKQNFSRVHHMLLHINRLFDGEVAPWQANDTAYHDIEHTLLVAYCWTQMFHSLARNKPEFPVIYTDLLLGIAACLLHDIGYLKESSDSEGTGAKFSLIHERRSCQFARRFLMTLQWPESAISVVLRMIASTGLRAVIDAIPFASPTEKSLAQMLATADFLAQMGHPKYAEKLPDLFAEFEEFDIARELSATDRSFPDLQSLVKGTAGFWYQFVLPRLKNDYGGTYLLLNQPYPDGPNPYVDQAESNVSKLIASL